MAEKNMVGLSIALVDDGRIAWARGFGWADRENGVSAQADTRYMLGSGSKTLTTVALLQLVDQGLLSLEKPATTYLPEFQLLPRFPGQMQNITVERLLNHHSGIPGDIYNGGFVAEAWNQWGCDLYIDWLLHCLANEYPSYAPGEISVYCNTGFVLAGEIAQRIGGRSGETFNEFMIRQLFSPLDMHDTSFRAFPGTMAVGYIGGAPLPPVETNCVFGATGGAVTTVLDMGRFLAMMLNRGRSAAGEQIIMPGTVDRMGQGERTPLDWNSYSTPGLGLDTMDDPVMRYAGAGVDQKRQHRTFQFVYGDTAGPESCSNCSYQLRHGPVGRLFHCPRVPETGRRRKNGHEALASFLSRYSIRDEPRVDCRNLCEKKRL